MIKLLYNDLRSQFGLKSQMAQSCIRTVIAKYRSVQTQLRKERVGMVTKKTIMVMTLKTMYQRFSNSLESDWNLNDLNWIWFVI